MRWREEDQWNLIGGWTKVGVGTLGGLAGAGVALGDRRALPVGIGVAGVGAGVIVWGIHDLTNPPPRPVPEWDIERKITITPPKNKGDVEVKVLQERRPAAPER